MTKSEANRYAETMNKYPNMYAEIVRILPEHVDPPKPKDNGWDVKITHLYDNRVYED